MNENKVKQLALRVDRELVRKIREIDEYLAAQSLYVRRSLSATIRFCVENQWLSMASLFAEREPASEPVVKQDVPVNGKLHDKPTRPKKSARKPKTKVEKAVSKRLRKEARKILGG